MSDSTQPSNTFDVAECTLAVEELLARYDWQLVERDLLIQRALLAYQSELATTLSRAVIYIYTLARYAACSGQEGRVRQNLAYTELSRELFRVAYVKYGERADDIVQAALEAIHRKFHTCRYPGAFFVFCLQQLRDEMRSARGKMAGEGRMENIDTTEESSATAMQLVAPRADPFNHLQQQELVSRLRSLVQQFGERYPRAGQQLQVLMLEFFEGLDAEEIAMRLGKDSVERIYELRSRARKKLAQDPEWQQLAKELDLGGKSVPQKGENHEQ